MRCQQIVHRNTVKLKLTNFFSQKSKFLYVNFMLMGVKGTTRKKCNNESPLMQRYHFDMVAVIQYCLQCRKPIAKRFLERNSTWHANHSQLWIFLMSFVWEVFVISCGFIWKQSNQLQPKKTHKKIHKLVYLQQYYKLTYNQIK